MQLAAPSTNVQTVRVSIVHRIDHLPTPKLSIACAPRRSDAPHPARRGLSCTGRVVV